MLPPGWSQLSLWASPSGTPHRITDSIHFIWGFPESFVWEDSDERCCIWEWVPGISSEGIKIGRHRRRKPTIWLPQRNILEFLVWLQMSDSRLQYWLVSTVCWLSLWLLESMMNINSYLNFLLPGWAYKFDTHTTPPAITRASSLKLEYGGKVSDGEI